MLQLITQILQDKELTYLLFFQKFLVVLSVVAVAMAQEQPANFACPNYPFCAIAPAAVAAPAAYQPHMDLYWAQRQALYQPVVDYSLPGMDQWYAAQAAVSISCISFISILIHNLVLQLQKGSSNIFHFIAARSTNGITPRKCHPPSSNCPS